MQKILKLILLIILLGCSNDPLSLKKKVNNMPEYTKLPTAVQTELEKKIGANPIVEVIIDPFDRNVKLDKRYDIINMSSITKLLELDLEYYDTPKFNDLRLDFNDPDGYFDAKNASSPFHNLIGETSGDLAAGDNVINLSKSKVLDFNPGEKVTITGANPTITGATTNNEEITVDAFEETASYYVITYNTGLSYAYASGSYVTTNPLENINIMVRIVFSGDTTEITQYLGKLFKAPKYENGVGSLIIVDPIKLNDDIELVGADSAAGTKLKVMVNGTLTDSVEVTGSGTFDRTKVHVFDNCKIDNAILTFADANSYELNAFGKTITRDNRYGMIANLPADNDLRGWNIVTDGSYLYLASQYTLNFTIVDITTPSTPTKRGSLALGGPVPSPYGVQISGNYAYACCHLGEQTTNKFQSIDITDPDNPASSDIITASDLSDTDFVPEVCKISGNYAYVISNADNGGLYIFDITDPTNMSLSGSIKGSANRLNTPSDLYVNGNYVYILVNGTDDYITTIDITNKAAPVLHAYTKINGMYLKYLDKSGDYLIVTDPTSNRVSIMDITDLSNITTVGSISGSGNPNYLLYVYEVVVSGNYAYVASAWDNSLVTIDISTKSSPTLVEAIGDGGGAPYYLEDVSGICTDSGYFYLTGTDGITVYRLAPPIKIKSDGLNIQIGTDAFGGTIGAANTMTFHTAINYDTVNVIQAMYNLLITQWDVDSRRIGSSSYFGNIELGTVNTALAINDTTVLVDVFFPTLIKTGETLTITEGATTEDVTVTSGNTETTQYPPYVSVDTSKLVSAYTTAATVTWKQRGSLDTDFNFDNFYSYCDTNSFNVKLTLKAMSRTQGLMTIAKHAGLIPFTDNWGVFKVLSLYRSPASSLPAITGTTNLKKPNPIRSTVELVNELNIQYGYNILDLEFANKIVYPASDDVNPSYIHNSFKRSKNLTFPGYWDSTIIEVLADLIYDFHSNGLTLTKFNMTLQGIIATLGDDFEIDSIFPDFTKDIRIVGIQAKNIRKRINIQLLGIDV